MLSIAYEAPSDIELLMNDEQENADESGDETGDVLTFTSCCGTASIGMLAEFKPTEKKKSDGEQALRILSKLQTALTNKEDYTGSIDIYNGGFTVRYHAQENFIETETSSFVCSTQDEHPQILDRDVLIKEIMEAVKLLLLM